MRFPCLSFEGRGWLTWYRRSGGIPHGSVYHDGNELAGLFTPGTIVYFDVQSSEFEAASFLLQNYPDEPDTVKVVSLMFYWPLLDVYGLKNMTGFYHNNSSIHSTPDVTDPVMQDKIDPSYNYVLLDTERGILVFDSHDKKFLKDIMKD